MATSIVKLHTLSGAGNNGSPCYLLQIDEFHCLLDCGWCENLESDYVKEVSKWAKHVDAVLLSHSSLRHLGLLPYLVGTCGLNCPVYATTPVYKMGQMFLYDFFQSRHACEDFSHYTLDDVDSAFDRVHQVKYQQTISLHGRGHGLCITPLPSGHTLGGTIWKLVKEDASIVYALDFNHKKERHLNGATFDACIRPHLLIMDGSNTLYTQPRRKDRDENLRQTILKSLRRGGNVLVAVDTAGRCLEIAHFLEQCWLNQESGLMAYGLAMLNYVALNVVDFAKSMVEWMSEKVMRSFEDQRSNPFHFRHMQLCHTLEQLDAVSEPKVVLSSLSDLSCGFSRQLFAEWADNDLNTVILTSQESVTTGTGESCQSLVSRLIGLAKKDIDARKDLPTSSTGTLILPLTLSQRVSCSQDERSGSDLPHLRNAAKNFLASQNTNSLASDICDELNPEVEPESIAVGFTDIPMPSANDVTNNDVSPQITEGIFEKQPSCESELENESTCGSNRVYVSEEGTHGEKSTALSLTLSVPRDHSKKMVVPSSTSKLFPQTSISLSMEQFGSTNCHLTSGRHQAGYDIYPGLHNQAGGQFFRVAKRTQLLFPQNEKKIYWDEYGAHLDPELFSSAEPISNHIALPSWDIKSKDTKSSSELVSSGFVSTSILDYLVAKTPAFDVLDSNTRCVTHHLEIPLRCEVVYLDYEGRSDGEAIKRILIGLRPQEIILVGNNAAAIDHLANYCRGVMLLDSNFIHIPHPQEIVNCTKEGDIYQARMKDSLVSSLKFTKIRDYELAWVEATVSLEDKFNYRSIKERNNPIENNNNNVEMSTTNGLELESKSRTPLAADQLPVLSLPIGPVGQHKTVFVNEPKLSDLKQLLLSQGLMAEFVSGILVVDNCVAIKRSEAGKLLLEGLLCGTYFEVRRILYQQFAIL
ncbi:hypothetical protein MN116_003500 [Schistosoma mekongi]|uniref:Cleavage and polyadenylation specificity factor subunit 2 n=1 Tax=Schistosoma mekongi TaxID=38744 RepID=A0AAE2D7C8_SCHME|nr:hypothetical protein MN116_003500 [Schistosoma mekongi]